MNNTELYQIKTRLLKVEADLLGTGGRAKPAQQDREQKPAPIQLGLFDLEASNDESEDGMG